ncbi:glycosyltransferase family 2 protein [Cellulomonas sp. URHD0024]|uniref:glycosyltransferase family 2 protein n=1 Tax=Cellulomonas sp. URHD0024 TaxID=1302620 RepID=UPI0006864DA4|nr:glycosyltransferase family 2 protein [Cellulomonas sp. URHD0024]
MPDRPGPTISVVIPVLDDAALLERCLQSLAAQQVAPSEVIVVDNGSADDSVRVASGHGAVVVSEPRRGIGYAAATGYDAAGGQIIARCDADSVLPSDWLARIQRAFADDERLGALTGPGRFYDAPPVVSWCAAVFYMRLYFAVMWVTLGHTSLFGSNCAFRSQAWRAVRREVHDGPDVHDDIDLSYHLGAVAVIRYAGTMHVGISARPLRSARGMAVRWRRGLRSVVVHWPHDFPWLRWSRRDGHVDRVPSPAGRRPEVTSSIARPIDHQEVLVSSPIPDPGRVPDGPDFTDLPDDRDVAPDTLANPDGPSEDAGPVEPPD